MQPLSPALPVLVHCAPILTIAGTTGLDDTQSLPFQVLLQFFCAPPLQTSWVLVAGL